MWEAIQHVGTPIALLAFIVAVVSYAYRKNLLHKIELIKTAPDQARPDLIRAMLQSYSIREDNLTRQQKYELLRSVIDEKGKRFRIIAFVSVVVSLVLATVIVIITIVTHTPNIVGSNDDSVPLSMPLRVELGITKPHDKDSVSRDSVIEWTTPFPDWNHYVIVTPNSTHTNSVQEAPAMVQGHTGSAQARFGEAGGGPGEQFTVQILATKSKLLTRSLTENPPDAKFSKPITVTLSE